MRLVKIGKRSWLVGMDWYAPAGGTDLDEIKHFVEAEGSDCISMRGNQVGHGKSNNDPNILKSRSLAGWISIPTNTFIGIFRLQDENNEPFWWVFARAEGHNIGGYGDAIYDNRDEALFSKDEIQDLLPQYTTIDDVVICETEEESLAWLTPRCEVGLISRWRGDALVSSISNVKSKQVNLTKRLLLTGGIIAALWAAGYYGMDLLTELGVTQEAKQKEMERQALRQKYQRNPELLFVQEWHKGSRADDTIALCMNSMNGVKLNWGGWTLKKSACRAGKSVSIVSTYGHTPMALFSSIPENATFNMKDKQIKEFFLTEPLDGQVRTMNGPDFKKLARQTDIKLALMQMAQNYSVTVKDAFRKPASKTVAEIGTYTCPWAKGTFEIEKVSSVKIGRIATILASIPGLTIKDISYDMDNWTIKGEM